MEKYVSLAVFISCYIGLITMPTWRAYCACGGAALLLLLGILTPHEAFWSINWNVMGIFVGTLVVAELLMISRMPVFLAESLVSRARSTGEAMLILCVLAGFISAFMENVATVLVVAPVAFAIARRLNVSPALLLISIAVCSNLQGTATMIGDSPGIILAGYMGMGFDDFFFYHGKPSIFFAVEIGALASFLVLYFLFRKYNQAVEPVEIEKVVSWVPTWILALLITCLAVASLIIPGVRVAGIICITFGIFGIVWYEFALDGEVRKFLKALDWDTALFLPGVFVVVGGLTHTGWITHASHLLEGLCGDNLLKTFLLVVWLSVILSAFVDNVPYLVATIPVVQYVGEDMGHSSITLLVFGLLVGSCLGGNITPVGASANMVAIGLLQKSGTPVTFMEFVRVGLPFTVMAVSTASVFLWLVWA
ncbi:MAG: SLC13 family permease [Candidatus Brocadiaceae bacterium]|nr:SLC13 family permease [Candidatus Brocadiaceae bacterium]